MNNIVEFFVDNSVMVLFLPLWCLLMISINSAVSFVASKKLTFNLSLGVNIFNIICSVFCLIYCLKNPQAFVEKNLVWLNNADFQVSMGTLVDNISAVIFLFFSVVILFLELYSFGYLKSDKNFHRFFMQLNFLKFAICGLIFSSNVIQTCLFGGLISIGAYLLANFQNSKKSVSDSAKVMFCVNFFGDLLLFAGGIAFVYFTITFSPVKNIVLLSYDNFSFVAEMVYSMVSEKTFVLISMLSIAGIAVKMMQFPFAGWAVKSTEASAPVNALLQGVLPVVGGGIIILRLYPLFILSKTVLDIFIFIGIISALLYAFSAMSQNNIKKLIAYLTASQLGFVFVAFGIGAYSAGVLQLFIHGVSKILLILTAGTVVWILNNENDIKYFGGLRKKMPILSASFFIGSLSLSGIAFGGFFANEQIFAQAFLSGVPLLASGILFAAFMGAYALFRAYFLVFEGEENCEKEPAHCSLRMNFLVIGFAVLTLLSGFCVKPIYNFVYFVLKDKINTEIFFVVIMLVVVLTAMYIAFRLYVSPYSKFVLVKEKMLNKKDFVYKLSYNGFYIDNLFYWITDKIILRCFRLFDFIEKYVIGAVVGIVPLSTRLGSYFVKKTGTGNLQTYIVYSLFWLAVLLAVITLMYVLGSMMEV